MVYHINGYQSAAGPVQTSESSPIRDRRSTTELHRQLLLMCSNYVINQQTLTVSIIIIHQLSDVISHSEMFTQKTAMCSIWLQIITRVSALNGVHNSRWPLDHLQYVFALCDPETLTSDLIHYKLVGENSAKFGDCSFSCFGSIAWTHTHTHTHTHKHTHSSTPYSHDWHQQE